MIPALLGPALETLVGSLVKTVVANLSSTSLTVGVEFDLKPLLALNRNARKCVFIGANRAAKPVRAAVETEANRNTRSGALAQSIGTKTRIYGGETFITVIGPKMSYSRSLGAYKRGPRRGGPKKAIPYLYAWLLNRGTKRSRANHFLDTAYQSTAGVYQSAVYREIMQELEKYMGKH